MNRYNLKRWLYLIGATIIVVAIALYINQSYAYIYNYIDRAALKSSDHSRVYQISNNSMASSSLVYAALGDSLTAGVGVENIASPTLIYSLKL